MLKAAKQEKAFSVIRKGDKVMAITGNYKGQVGTVISRTDSRVVVSGLNMKKKHVRRTNENQAGGIIEMERSMHISNVALCSPTNQPVKVRKRINKQGEKELYYTDGGKQVLFRNMKKSA